MKAKTFERKFDDGKDITDALDLTKARRCLIRTLSSQAW